MTNEIVAQDWKIKLCALFCNMGVVIAIEAVNLAAKIILKWQLSASYPFDIHKQG